MNKKIYNAMVFFIVAIMAVSCKQNPVSLDTDQKIHQDTSIFLGTWAAVFDTAETPAGWGEQKFAYWFVGGGFIKPDTSSYVNDTLIRQETTGFESNYYYTKDSIYYYNIVEGRNSATGVRYYLSNDSLIFNCDSTKYVPVYKKVQ